MLGSTGLFHSHWNAGLFHSHWGYILSPLFICILTWDWKSWVEYPVIWTWVIYVKKSWLLFTFSSGHMALYLSHREGFSLKLRESFRCWAVKYSSPHLDHSMAFGTIIYSLFEIFTILLDTVTSVTYDTLLLFSSLCLSVTNRLAIK